MGNYTSVDLQRLLIAKMQNLEFICQMQKKKKINKPVIQVQESDCHEFTQNETSKLRHHQQQNASSIL